MSGNSGTSTLTWSLAGADAGDFSIGSDGALTFNSVPDFENPADKNKDNAYKLKVRVSNGSVTSIRAVSVIVTDVNEPPKFPDTLSPSIQIIENSPRGANIGAPFTASDPDKAARFNKLTYSLGGEDAGSFKIADKSGQIKVKAALDYETKDTYYVTVGVSDGRDAGGLEDASADDTIDVTITLADDPDDAAAAQREAWKRGGLTAAGGHHLVILAWDDPEDATITGYQYKQKGPDGGRYGDWIDIPGDTTTLTHTITDLGWGTYVYRLRAKTSSGFGVKSNEASATVDQETDSRVRWENGGSMFNKSISEDGGSARLVAEIERYFAPNIKRNTTFTISVSHPDRVKLSLSGDSHPDDSVSSSGATLTIAAGQHMSSGYLTVTAVDNDVDEEHLYVRVYVTAFNPLGVKQPKDEITLRIRDDD